ncbi:Uncharacterised protein [Mycobacteroides abscessus]|nr:Uncharacterised protein [Mycobacteroides abscessus]
MKLKMNQLKSHNNVDVRHVVVWNEKNKRMTQQQVQQIKFKTNKNHKMINTNSFLNVL